MGWLEMETEIKGRKRFVPGAEVLVTTTNFMGTKAQAYGEDEGR